MLTISKKARESNCKLKIRKILLKYKIIIFTFNRYFSQSERHDYRYQNRATISVYRAEKAKERIEEYARLQKARSLLDAVNLGEELLSDGSDVEILSLSKVIVKRLRFLGVSGIPRRDKELEKLEEGCRRFNFESFHSGVYHCCTFCSSGGKREVPCACGKQKSHF